MYCDKCGAKIPDDSVFCDVCGEEVIPGGSKQNSGQGKTSIKENPSASSKAVKIIPIVVVVLILGLLAGLRQSWANKSSKEANETSEPVETAQTHEQDTDDQPIVSETSKIDNGGVSEGADGSETVVQTDTEYISSPDQLDDSVKKRMMDESIKAVEAYKNNMYEYPWFDSKGSEPQYEGLCVMSAKDPDAVNDKNVVLLVYSVKWTPGESGQIDESKLYYPVTFADVKKYDYGIDFDPQKVGRSFENRGGIDIKNAMPKIWGYTDIRGMYTDLIGNQDKYYASPDNELASKVYEKGLLGKTGQTQEAFFIRDPSELSDEVLARMKDEALKIIDKYKRDMYEYAWFDSMGSEPLYEGLCVMLANDPDSVNTKNKVMLVYSVEWIPGESGQIDETVLYYPVIFGDVRQYDYGVDYDPGKVGRSFENKGGIDIKNAMPKIWGYTDIHGLYTDQVGKDDKYTAVRDKDLDALLMQ